MSNEMDGINVKIRFQVLGYLAKCRFGVTEQYRMDTGFQTFNKVAVTSVQIQ